MLIVGVGHENKNGEWEVIQADRRSSEQVVI